MALTRAQLAALIAANLPNNVSKLITPAKHREVEDALTAGAVNVEDDLIATSAGAGSAGKVPKLDGSGLLDASFIPGGGVGAAWGDITGTLSDQTDLQAALDLLAPLDSPEITGEPFFDLSADGLSINVGGDQAGSIDELGWLFRLPIIESIRMIGDGDSSAISLSDLAINGTRTNGVAFDLPAIGDASEGQHLVIAHSGTGSQPVNANAAGEIYDGATGDVDSITLAVGEVALFRAFGSRWRVFGRYISKNVAASQMPALTGPVSTSAGAVATTMYWDRQIACSDLTTAITSGVTKGYFRVPRGVTLTAVRASVLTAPTGASLVIDINENGTTILSIKLSIDAGEKTSVTAATPPVISDAALADDAEITIDFDQVGSTIAGAGVIVTLIGTITG